MNLRTPEKTPDEPLLLVVDDDEGIRDLLCRYLAEQGFRVAAAADGPAMDQWLADNTPDLVILDLMLPGEDGLSLARRLRGDQNPPMISARGDDVDRIVGLEVGADDYLAKPFNPRELLARVRAVLRRNCRPNESDTQDDSGYSFGPFLFDPLRRTLSRGDQQIELSRAELDLLNVFVRHPNRVLSRDFIMEDLAGNNRDPLDRSVDVRVTRLRHKIEDDPSHPRFVKTVWGVGYQFNTEPTTN
ncbi:MAG: response regulator [Gammaproteobacteria bacterium]|nr:response regulator [Gammaproteobacteria bacterium]